MRVVWCAAERLRTQPNRLAAAAVDVRQLDGFSANLQNPISAFDDIPFTAMVDASIVPDTA